MAPVTASQVMSREASLGSTATLVGAGSVGVSQKKIKMLRAVFAVDLFAVLLWWGIDAYQPKGTLATSVTVMVCLAATHGLCALIFRSRDEEAKHQPVLAPFLERHVLNPLGKRLEQRRLGKWRE